MRTCCRPEHPVASVAAGGYHTVALLTDGSVACWGAGTTNTGSFPNYGHSIVPSGIGTPENPVASVAAGSLYTVLVLTDGSVACWGRNNEGQCDVPSGIGTPWNPVTSVAAGFLHTVVVLGLDRDNDGWADSFDACPNDPLKTVSAGDCGCGVVETNVHGDVDCDGDYDEDDVRAGMADFGITASTPGDMDGDDDADVADFTLLRNQIGVETLGCVAADINGDGEVDGADFAYVLGYWGLCSAP